MSHDACFICGDVNGNSHQDHHIVPRRFGGSDSDENVVTLCASCHQAVEKLYDKRFYDELGVRNDGRLSVSSTGAECDLSDCTAPADVQLPTDDRHDDLRVCEGHATCDIRACTRSGEYAAYDHPNTDPDNGVSVAIVCTEHRTCDEEGCLNPETYLVDPHPEFAASSRKAFCDTHANEAIFDAPWSDRSGGEN